MERAERKAKISGVKAKRKFLQTQCAPRKKEKKRRIHAISKKRFLKALDGTGGVRLHIAERLGCRYGLITDLIHKEGWEDVIEAVQQEEEKVGDLAEDNIMRALRREFGTDHAVQTSRWVLSRVKHSKRGMMEAKITRIEGGNQPVQVQTTQVSVDALDLPIEIRRRLLRAIEESESSTEEEEEV